MVPTFLVWSWFPFWVGLNENQNEDRSPACYGVCVQTYACFNKDPAHRTQKPRPHDTRCPLPWRHVLAGHHQRDRPARPKRVRSAWRLSQCSAALVWWFGGLWVWWFRRFPSCPRQKLWVPIPNKQSETLLSLVTLNLGGPYSVELHVSVQLPM